MLVVPALLVRTAVVAARPSLVVPAALIALIGLVLLGALAPRRARATRRAAESGGPGADRPAARLVTGLVVLTAVLALAADLLARA